MVKEGRGSDRRHHRRAWPRGWHPARGARDYAVGVATTLTRILVHATFATRKRAALIPEAHEDDLYAYTGGICRRFGSPLLQMGGTADHVHLLLSRGKSVALADLMLEVKRDTSKWMKRREPWLSAFSWQDGYFAFSVGESGVPAVRAYIGRQKEHHRRLGFQDEMRAFFRKYGVEWDERFVWD